MPAMLSATLLCLIVAVGDHATLTARCDAAHPQRTQQLRLAGIALPHPGQPFATVARETLAELCLHQRARITHRGRRADGIVRVDMECGGLGAQQHLVALGLARVVEPVAPEQAWLRDIQRGAQQSRMGQWRDLRELMPNE